MIGKPYEIPKDCSLLEMEEHRNIIQDTMNQLTKESNEHLH
jgi:hypothetical protein